MNQESNTGSVDRRLPLLDQLAWFIRLRWIAGGVVVIGSLADHLWLHEYDRPLRLTVVGAVVLIYNAALIAVLPRMRRRQWTQATLDAFAGVQILLDLACLTLMTLWTGGVNSPLLGFFVFHMVFASLLLPQFVAYASMTVAVAMFGAGLSLTGRWPTQWHAMVQVGGWVVMLLFTVYLTSKVTLSLRRQRQRLVKQNRRVRRMSRRLRSQQQAMIQHEKMAALGQMAAGVAHEVANPLASMDSLLQLMERKPDKPRPDAIATLREQIARIKTILRQMNSFAHPSDMRWERMNVNDMVEQGLSMLRYDPRTRGVAIEYSYAADAGTVFVQPQAMQQVLVNLTMNALDAVTEATDPRIVIRTAGNDEWSSIAVSDNGHGIRPEHLEHLFEPFFTTKPVGKGTGLGLSISYSLVQKHGGRIEVTSQPAHGASFTVWLPRNAEASRNREKIETPNPIAERV